MKLSVCVFGAYWLQRDDDYRHQYTDNTYSKAFCFLVTYITCAVHSVPHNV